MKKKIKEYSVSPSNITPNNQNVPIHCFFFCDYCNKQADTHVKVKEIFPFCPIWKILFSIMFYIKALCQTLKNAPGICEQ